MSTSGRNILSFGKIVSTQLALSELCSSPIVHGQEITSTLIVSTLLDKWCVWYTIFFSFIGKGIWKGWSGAGMNETKTSQSPYGFVHIALVKYLFLYKWTLGKVIISVICDPSKEVVNSRFQSILCCTITILYAGVAVTSHPGSNHAES